MGRSNNVGDGVRKCVVESQLASPLHVETYRDVGVLAAIGGHCEQLSERCEPKQEEKITIRPMLCWICYESLKKKTRGVFWRFGEQEAVGEQVIRT